METLKIDCFVARGGWPYLFEATLHLSQSRSKRQIDQQFYNDRCGGGFDGQHVEIELESDISFLSNNEKIPVYRTPDERIFVSWLKQIPNASAAKDIFDAWCAGVIYTSETGNDFWPKEPGDECDMDALRKYKSELRIFTDTQFLIEDLTAPAAS